MKTVYLITNTINGNTYVGKTTKSIQERFTQHCKSSKKPNSHIHRSIKLYGSQNFKIEILEENLIDIDQCEKNWIERLKPELNMTMGGEGGSTTHNKMWVTDGKNNLYIDKGTAIPENFHKGRFCKFSDPKFQKELSLRADPEKRRLAIKKAWDEGRIVRDNSKLGKSGDLNPSKRPEVKQKISEWQLLRAKELVTCPHCGKVGKNSVGMINFHFNKCKKNDKSITFK